MNRNSITYEKTDAELDNLKSSDFDKNIKAMNQAVADIELLLKKRTGLKNS